MMIAGKNINDECIYCGDMLQCKLFKQGHGIRCKRENITEMVRCQMRHERERKHEDFGSNETSC